MCDCYTPAGEPIPTNKRHAAAKIFSNPAVSAEEPWYCIWLTIITALQRIVFNCFVRIINWLIVLFF